MQFEFVNPITQSAFCFNDEVFTWNAAQTKKLGLIHIVWNNGPTPVRFLIDAVPFELAPQQICTFTYLYYIKLLDDINDVLLFSFNRAFYCIVDHDEEVSCNGIIFFGTQGLTVIDLDEKDNSKLSRLLDVFKDEFETKDRIQEEMLRMLLKRLIIICTRLARMQTVTSEISNQQLELIRKFNVLVDIHFREKKTVQSYADLLFKSPKTLSNMFNMYGDRTPLQIIQERTLLEARRLLTYTDKSNKEIALEIGFEEASAFGKFFKKNMETTPLQFKEAVKNRS
ncbi:MAG: helix-turn-helix domain-containing protein [Flavobacteriales bacterium]|nr:helix-turn-helix domain-containing protein [Flavobacteriales bacterium]